MDDEGTKKIMENILKANDIVINMVKDTRMLLLGLKHDSAEEFTNALRHVEATRNCVKKAMGAKKRGRPKNTSS
jgi:hypothetical protein